jgi:hypothetical protein
MVARPTGREQRPRRVTPPAYAPAVIGYTTSRDAIGAGVSGTWMADGLNRPSRSAIKSDRPDRGAPSRVGLSASAAPPAPSDILSSRSAWSRIRRRCHA